MEKISEEKIDKVISWFNLCTNFRPIEKKDRLHPNLTMCGILKLAELAYDQKGLIIEAKDEDIYLTKIDNLRSGITEADIEYLFRCSVYYDGVKDMLVIATD